MVNGVKALGSTLGNVASTGLKVFSGVSAAATAGVTAFGALSKSALDAVGDFEQLKGGIETLFGTGGASLEEYAASVSKTAEEVTDEYNLLMEAQELALDNANKAYKTAGLSANKYMETVTSFAASLKQSTENELEAAKAADQAVIDMADNVNKMGSSMESIQNAYQGFAKQNYTMLDNLKLGYGGTKSEMERLLADATALSGIEYDINSLNDIYSAIHVIQTELGITGTTAKEASTTIQGSLSSMSAAWENFLAGTGDVDQLVDAVKNSADIIAKNLVEIVPRLAEGLVDISDALIPHIGSMITELLPTISEGAMTLVDALAGDVMSELIVCIASCAPQITKMSVSVVKSFVTGIYDNRGEILKSGKSMANVFINGLISLMPTGMKSIAREAVQEIKTSLNSGGLKSAFNNSKTLVKNLSKEILNITKVVIPAFVKILDFCGENMKTIITVIGSCVAAYKTLQIINTITAFMESNVVVTKLMGAATSLLTGKITLATAAQTAWNFVMNANPIGLLITAVAALAAGIAIYAASTEDVITAEEMHAERVQQLSDEIAEEKQNWEDLQKAKQEQIDSDMTMIDHTQALWNELQKLVDKNGKVKEGYEERAAFITGELSDSLGVEIEMVDGVIAEYDKLSDSIDMLIQKKRAQAILDANEASYTDALTKQREAEMKQAEASLEVKKKQAEIEQQLSDIEAQKQKITDMRAEGNIGIEMDYESEVLKGMEEALKADQQALAALQSSYDDAEQTVSGYYQTIHDYEALAGAIAAENADGMQDAIDSITTSQQEATATNLSEQARQLLNQQEHMELLRQAYNEGADGITQDMLAKEGERLGKMQTEYDKEVSNVDEYTKNIAGLMDKLNGEMSEDEAKQLGIWMAMVADAEAKGKDISDETKEMVDTVMENLDSMPEQTRETMKDAMSPMLEEMESAEPSLFEKASGIASGILSRLKTAFDIHSPSRKTRKIFNQVMQGAELGLEDEEDKLYAQTDGIGKKCLARFEGAVSGTNGFFKNASASLSTAMANTSYARQEQSEANITNEVYVYLEGDADGVFKLVRQENNIFKKATGQSAFA